MKQKELEVKIEEILNNIQYVSMSNKLKAKLIVEEMEKVLTNNVVYVRGFQ